jgi:hypothetical protein
LRLLSHGDFNLFLWCGVENTVSFDLGLGIIAKKVVFIDSYEKLLDLSSISD